MVNLKKEIYALEIPLVESFAQGRSQFVKLLKQENGFMLPQEATMINASHTDSFILVSVRIKDEKLFLFKTTMGKGQLANCISLINSASAWNFPVVLSLKENTMQVSFYSMGNERDERLKKMISLLF